MFRARRKAMCTAVIAAAGSSQRMGGEDKLFAKVNGIPVLAHTLTAFEKCDQVDEIIVVAREDKVNLISEICTGFSINKASAVILGGATRLESVRSGVDAVSGKASLIAVHDGARPCVSKEIIEKTIEKARKCHAAVPAVPVYSTVKESAKGIVVKTVDRKDLFEIQTPQVFEANLLKAALSYVCKKGIDVTDDAMAVELIGAAVHLTEGSRRNIKISTKEDLGLAEAILAIVTHG